jgi:hypothetical protein
VGNQGWFCVGVGVYQLVRQYLPTPGQPVVDFGHCLLRLDAGE